MTRFRGLVLVSLLLAGPVFAGGDICVSDGAAKWVFSKPKVPKPGGSASLAGFYLIAGPQLVSGSFVHPFPPVLHDAHEAPPAQNRSSTSTPIQSSSR